MNALIRTVRDYGRMVRFSHSIFALPFALASVAFASLRAAVGASQVFWVLVAMVAARNAAMGFNRLVDAEIDARNPRTAAREIPRGVLKRFQVGAFVLALSILFVFVGSSRVDLQACKLEYSIVSPK